MTAVEENTRPKRLSSTLKRVPLIRQFVATIRTMQAFLVDDIDRARGSLDRTFQGAVDPFAFDSPEEQRRFCRALDMLNAARTGDCFENVLEVGCAEGMFTQMLSLVCKSVLAVDCSDIALTRARQRCAALHNVTFKQWDVRCDRLQGTFDLVLAVGVLEYIRRPKVARNAVQRLVHALNPGGLLLVGTTVKPAEYQETWLGKKLLVGTNLHDYIARHPALALVNRVDDEYRLPFEHALFRKRDG